MSLTRVTITGADDGVDPAELRKLSEEFPFVEFGILISEKRAGEARYPSGELEAAHQQVRWPSEHDAGKAPSDWFWLLGYLAGKALAAAERGDTEKALHHTISSAAVLANWHAALSGASNEMRPGIAEPTETP